MYLSKVVAGLFSTVLLHVARACPVKELQGSTYRAPMFVPGIGTHCYRLQFVKNGIFEYDLDTEGATDCCDATFQHAEKVSIVKSSSGSTISLAKAPGGLSIPGLGQGKIVFSEDASIDAVEMNFIKSSGGQGFNMYEVNLRLPACSTSSPSASPTIPPSSAPSGPAFCDAISPSEYILPAKFGKLNHCYKIQVEEDGELLVDRGDPGCAKFNLGGKFRGIVLSHYNRTDPGGEAIFDGKWSGSISLLQDPSLDEAKFKFLSADTKKKTFSTILTVPSCSI